MPAEFSLPDRFPTNRSGPGRWLFSHFLRYWYLGLLLIFGAYGNAYLAAVIPIKIGEAFDLITADATRLDLLAEIAWAIVISQVIRGVLQFGRNFSAEWLGQLYEQGNKDFSFYR